MRSKKKKKEVNESPHEKEVEKDPKVAEEEINGNTDDKKQEIVEKDPEKKKKEENIFQRLIRRLSFRSKKKKEKSTTATSDEEETSPSIPVISASRPPLPTMRRPPCSATTAQSRPVSQLDSALKQFKLSTAASRENLRSSRVDISQVEEQVKAMVTSRPSTPTPAGWRSRAPPENRNLTDQWAKLSSSMTDLR